MQALIDFDGWRKWKDFSQQAGNEKEEAAKLALKEKIAKKKKNRMSLGSNEGARGSSNRLVGIAVAAGRDELSGSVGGDGVVVG